MTSITLPFLQDLLKEDYPDVTIQHFEGAPGSNRGDNYTSMVYRVTLTGIRKSIEPDGSSEHEEHWQSSIIYKCLPENTIRREAFKSDELFCNEVAFYTKIWPAFQEFQAQWDVKHPFKCIPKCYLAQNDLVILKDLKQMGFAMIDRRKGFTIEQCYFVLKHLSQFHALSLAMKYHDPEGFHELINLQDGISEVFFVDENQEYYRNYYDEAIQNAISMVEEGLKDNRDKDVYMKKFRDFCQIDTFFNTMMELVNKNREPLAVICHGDCWTNNLLFRHVDGELAEMYMVDFQIVRYASPALDLAYLLYLCLDRQQRTDHLSSLLEYYTDELHKGLLEMSDEDSIFRSTLNRDSLYEMLQQELQRTSLFGLGMSLDMYPILTCDSNEAPNLYQAKEIDAAQSHDSIKPVWTANEQCRKKMTELVIELVDGGLL